MISYIFVGLVCFIIGSLFKAKVESSFEDKIKSLIDLLVVESIERRRLEAFRVGDGVNFKKNESIIKEEIKEQLYKDYLDKVVIL